MLYHFGKPRASLEYAKSSIFDFRPSTRVFDVSNFRLSLCLQRQRSTRPPRYSDVIVTVLCNSVWRQHWNRLRRFCCLRRNFTTNYMQDSPLCGFVSLQPSVHPLFKRVMSSTVHGWRLMGCPCMVTKLLYLVEVGSGGVT